MAKNLAVQVVIGGTLSSTFRTAFAGAGASVRTLGATAKALGDKQKALGASIEKYAGTLAPASLAGMHRDYQRLGQLIDEAKRKQDALSASLRRAGMLRSQRGELIGSAFGTVAVGMTMAAPFAIAVRAARDFESAMADVRKVVDFETPAGFQRLGKEIRDLATQIPRTQTELAQIAAAGGAGGIKEKDLKTYTEMAAKMATAWEMSTDQVGASMVKLGNIYALQTMPRMRSLGDAINKLADDGASKAGEIVDVMQRIGGQAHQLGVGTEFAAALSTTFLDLGQSAEVSGTSINAMLSKFAQAPQQNKKFHVALKELGISSKQLQQDMVKDAEGTIIRILEKIRTFDKVKQVDLVGRLFGAEYADNLSSLTDNVDLLKHKIDSVRDNRAAGSVEREFQARAKTFANTSILLRNNLRNLQIEVGSALLPALNETLTAVTPLIKQFTAWAEKNPELIADIAKLGAGLIGAKLALTGVQIGANLTMTALNSFRIATALLSGKLTVLKVALEGTSFAPLTAGFSKATAAAKGLTVAGVGAAGVLVAVGAAAGYGFGKFADTLETKEDKEKRIAARKSRGMQAWVDDGTPAVPFRRPTGMDTLRGDLKKVGDEWTRLQKKLQSMTGSAVKKFGEFKDKASAKIGEAWTSIKAQFDSGIAYIKGLVGQFFDFGAAVIGGLVEGIKSKLAAARAAIVGVGQTIKSTITGALGIKSPSTVFAGFGRMIIGGLVQGLGAASPALGRALGGVYNEMTRPPLPSIGGNVVPFSPPPAKGLSAAGGTFAGGTGGVVINIHAPITISGNADPAKTSAAVSEAFRLSVRELERVSLQLQHAHARTSYR